MPINNIQFRAEIGLFNNICQCSCFITKSSFIQIITSIFNNISLSECSSYIRSFFFHVICSAFVLLIFPFIVLFKLSFCSVFNLSNCFIDVYIYVYIFMHFIINLIHATIVCRKAFAKFILWNNFFLQICTLLPFIKLALMISGDIERNPGPENVHNQNLSLCHWNLNGITANNFIKTSLLQSCAKIIEKTVKNGLLSLARSNLKLF